jgi:hypothetical protein
MKRCVLILMMSFFLVVSCARKLSVPRQYLPYYTEQGKLIADDAYRSKFLPLPKYMGEEILTSYLSNNLLPFEDTTGVDETTGIFEFKIKASGEVEEIGFIKGDIPKHAQQNLIKQFRKMTFEPTKKRFRWYLPLYLEVPQGSEISPTGGYIFEGRLAYAIWVCHNPRDGGVKYKFQPYR